MSLVDHSDVATARTKRVLVLGASGILGSAMFRVLSEDTRLTVAGTFRNPATVEFFTLPLQQRTILVQDLLDEVSLAQVLDGFMPDVVVNCLAPPKQEFSNPMLLMLHFAVFARRLLHLCRHRQIRLIQMSSDGVFSGQRGNYTEDDFPDATDPYGVAKMLGEVENPNAITLRSSIIGHELHTRQGLLEWFLSQKDACRCFTKAMFSGFPAVVFAQIVRDVVIPRPDLHGIYHVSTSPISKFHLLELVASRYGSSIRMVPDDSVVIDRSLSSARFHRDTGYVPPEWPALIETMHSYNHGLKDR